MPTRAWTWHRAGTGGLFGFESRRVSHPGAGVSGFLFGLLWLLRVGCELRRQDACVPLAGAFFGVLFSIRALGVFFNRKIWENRELRMDRGVEKT